MTVDYRPWLGGTTGPPGNAVDCLDAGPEALASLLDAARKHAGVPCQRTPAGKAAHALPGAGLVL